MRNRIRGLAIALGAGALTSSARPLSHTAPPRVIVVTEVIAVYVGAIGTDSLTGIAQTLSDMSVAVTRQTASSGRGFLMRGVSIEPMVGDAVRHLSNLAHFDEISAGGNWTNSAVVRYLGGREGRVSDSAIPELILLERDVRHEGPRMLQVESEREIARFVGLDEITGWVKRGAPLAHK